jgi:exosortase/archaeosortase family protein
MRLIERIKTEYGRRKRMYVFFLRLIALYILWVLFYAIASNVQIVRVFVLNAVQPIVDTIVWGSASYLRILGFEPEVYENVIRIPGTRGIQLEYGCWAFDLMVLFAAVILAFPGKCKPKLIIIPIGIVFIHILNIIRNGSLCLIQYCCPQYMDINHHVIFKAVVYIAIFFMWRYYVKHFMKNTKVSE